GQDGGVVEYTFTVTRTGYLGGTSTVNWNVAGYSDYSGYGWNPTNAADFENGVLPSGVLTFLPDETTQTITVRVNSDLVPEEAESFIVQLGGGSGYTYIINDSALGTATRDEAIFNVLSYEVAGEG